MTKDGILINSYIPFDDYIAVFYNRAIGELPEMESSKATANIVSDLIQENDKILDIGCGVGHTYRSLFRSIDKPFSYHGVDYFDGMIEAAEKAWENHTNAKFTLGDIHELPFDDQSHEIVICTNMLLHLTNIVQPIKELARVTKRTLVIRTLIDDRSWVIQEVFNKNWFKYTDIDAEREFKDDGTPRLYHLHNIYSHAYFTSLVHRFVPNATIKMFADKDFSAVALGASAKQTSLPNPTAVLNDRQIFGGTFFQPWTYVIVSIN